MAFILGKGLSLLWLLSNEGQHECACLATFDEGIGVPTKHALWHVESWCNTGWRGHRWNGRLVKGMGCNLVVQVSVAVCIMARMCALSFAFVSIHLM